MPDRDEAVRIRRPARSVEYVALRQHETSILDAVRPQKSHWDMIELSGDMQN